MNAYIATDDSLLTDAGLALLQSIGANGSTTPTSSTTSSLNTLTSHNVGCTAVTAYVRGKKLYVANAGDSRCIMSQRRGTLRELSEDHKPELPAERDRILAAGGYVTAGRVNGNLNLTRCIGDHNYKKPDLPHAKQIISCVPDVCVVDLEEAEPDFVVLACDGIWDVMDNENVINYVRKRLLPKSRSVDDASPDSGRLDAHNKRAGAEQIPWPAEVAQGSLLKALEVTAKQVVDKSLAAESKLGIGCDNMSFMVVLFKSGEFGKDVIGELAEMKKKMEEEEKKEEEEGEKKEVVNGEN